MKARICIVVVTAWLAAASQAMAQYCELERIHVRSQGDGMSADFSSVDTSTCALGIETTVHVEGSEGVIKVADHCGRGGNHYTSVMTSQTNVVAVAVTVYDRCLAAEVLSVTGVGDADHLHLSNNLKTASLRATFEGLNEFDETVSIAIDLVWSSVGQRAHTVDHDNLDPGLIGYAFTSSGTVISAVAAGTVTVDGVDETPLESTQGTIERDTLHELIVYR